MLRAASIRITTTGETLYGGLTQSQFVPEAAGISYRVYNATAIWDLGFADLTSSTSYGKNTQDFRQDITMLLGGLESYIEQTTSVERIRRNFAWPRMKTKKSTGWSAPTTTMKTV